jgi:hypothetical protein
MRATASQQSVLRCSGLPVEVLLQIVLFPQEGQSRELGSAEIGLVLHSLRTYAE